MLTQFAGDVPLITIQAFHIVHKAVSLRYLKCGLHNNVVSKVKFSLQYAMKAQRETRGRAPLSPNPGTRCGWMVNTMPQVFYPQTEARHLFQQAGWAPEPVWMGYGEEKSLAPARDRTLDCPANSESLYQLHYPGSFKVANTSDYIAGVVIYTSSGSHISEGNLETSHELLTT
jgi:hypothetical protein